MHNQIDMGHARALLALEPARQVMAAQQIVQKGLSVREAERLANSEQKPVKRFAKARPNRDLLRLEELAADHMGARVSIKQGAKGSGKLVIEYKDLDQLDGILSRMGVSSRE